VKAYDCLGCCYCQHWWMFHWIQWNVVIIFLCFPFITECICL